LIGKGIFVVFIVVVLMVVYFLWFIVDWLFSGFVVVDVEIMGLFVCNDCIFELVVVLIDLCGWV